ncbi:hypothetical protein ACFV5N_25950 [Streptomyces sp. NPDC059853]|uniref:hypothetical protein n=1 Tax=Streptomyces sp. NPDC059853 TaxID=3346973 RepID=UPI0036645CB7
MMTDSAADAVALPPVAPEVTAALARALSPRLRKRLDAAAAKLAARPRGTDGTTVRIAVDDDTTLDLHAPAGVVATADAIRCGCLLAPDCVHRAAVAALAPVAEERPEDEADGPAGLDGADAPGGPGAPDTPPAAPGTGAPTRPGASGHPAPEPATPLAAAAPAQHTEPSEPTPEQPAAAALWRAGAAVLESGIQGAGALLQAELLHAAHTARLAGLHRPAALAVATVNGLRAARAGDPGHRLAELTATVQELLLVCHALRRAPSPGAPGLAELRGTARRPYTPGGSLRLYGLCCEPVLAGSGHAGVVTWTVDADGEVFALTDVAPGGAARAAGAARRTVRLGDAACTHQELARGGLIVSGATVSPDRRLGAGRGVRAVRARGVPWHEEPAAALWRTPLDQQIARALDAAGPGSAAGLLFTDLTVLGPVREPGAPDVLAAACAGLTVRIAPADEHQDLAHRHNLRLLAATPGLRLRVIARLVPAGHPRLRLLAAGPAPGAEPGPGLRAPVDLGYHRLQRADLTGTDHPGPSGPPADPAVSAATPAPPPVPAEPAAAPLHLLRRRTQAALAAGRPALALPGSAGTDRQRLRQAGLSTAADLLDELHRAAADRTRDVFGRLRPADADRFALAWLAADHYGDRAARALCAAAWALPGPARVA